MSASFEESSAPNVAPARDPRPCVRIPAHKLILDQRIQREIDNERVARMVNEFDWDKFEPLTVHDNGDGTYAVVEGQNRTAAMHELAPLCEVWCVVIDAPTSAGQAEVALAISDGRRVHSAYEKWRLCATAGHPHEVAANAAMWDRGLRLGKAPSAMTIGAVATVRTIVRGGGKPPEYGAELLGWTLDVAMRAYPHGDHESAVTRWSREVLMSISGILTAFPEVDEDRLVASLRSKPAVQWISMGRGNMGDDRPAYVVMREKLIDEYNRKLRKGRLGDE